MEFLLLILEIKAKLDRVYSLFILISNYYIPAEAESKRKFYRSTELLMLLFGRIILEIK